MKKILLIVLLLIVGCFKEPINFEQMLVERDNVYYTKDTNKPYSGPYVLYYKNGQKELKVLINDGEEHGLYTRWYDNGQK